MLKTIYVECSKLGYCSNIKDDICTYTMKIAVPTISLGRASAHSLEDKLAAASKAGLAGVELFWECFETYAATIPGNFDSTEARYIESARILRELCDKLDLEIIALQPFANFDGLRDTTERLGVAETWLRLMMILGATYLQVPANFAEAQDTAYANTQEGGADEVVIQNLRKLSDLIIASASSVIVTYEPMCWSTYVDTWKHGLDIIRAVNRANVVFCLDTFHIAGREYGDPSALSGKSNDSNAFENSVLALGATLKKSEIGYVQLSDALLMSPPIPENPLTDSTQRPRMNWSRTSRVFPHCGGYLPLVDLVRELLKTGYDGWISMETFHTDLYKRDPQIPYHQAMLAQKSWKSFSEAVGVCTV